LATPQRDDKGRDALWIEKEKTAPKIPSFIILSKSAVGWNILKQMSILKPVSVQGMSLS